MYIYFLVLAIYSKIYTLWPLHDRRIEVNRVFFIAHVNSLATFGLHVVKLNPNVAISLCETKKIGGNLGSYI